MPSPTKPSSSRVALLVAMPSAWPSEVAETSGAAARMSTAWAARESRRRPATAARAANHGRSMLRSSAIPSSASAARAVEKMPDPGLARPRDFGGERAGAGQQRAGQGGHPAALPIPNQRGAQRRPLAAAIEPGMDREGGAEQRRMPVGARFEVRLAAALIASCCARSGPDKPPIKSERVLGGSEQQAALEHRRYMINPQAHPFDQGGEVPGIDRLAVDRGLTAHRVEPGALGPGRVRAGASEGRIEPGDGAGGAFEGRGDGSPPGPRCSCADRRTSRFPNVQAKQQAAHRRCGVSSCGRRPKSARPGALQMPHQH